MAENGIRLVVCDFPPAGLTCKGKEREVELVSDSQADTPGVKIQGLDTSPDSEGTVASNQGISISLGNSYYCRNAIRTCFGHDFCRPLAIWLVY